MRRCKKTSSGYVALISVIIIGAVLLMIVITSAYIGITQGLNSSLYSNHLESESLVSACGEQALINLKDDSNYGGSETVNLGNGQCQILPIQNLGGQARIIQVSSNVGGATKKNKITVSQINPTIKITSWQEVADF